MSVAEIAEAVRRIIEEGEYEISVGDERWRRVGYPGFRLTERLRAKVVVSSLGRMADRLGETIQAIEGGGYAQVSVPVFKEGVYRPIDDVMLHNVVAYTFLGSPADETMTVDHINRMPHDNRVENLRWASPEQQRDNRMHRVHKYILEDGTVLDNGRELSEHLEESYKTVSNQTRVMRDGGVYTMGPNHETVTVVEVSAKKPRLTNKSQNPFAKKPKQTVGKDEVAARLYADGHDMSYIMSHLPSSSRSPAPDVHNVYLAIGRGMRNTRDVELIRRVAGRMGLDCPSVRDRLQEAWDVCKQSLKGLTRDEYTAAVGRFLSDRGIEMEHPRLFVEGFKCIYETLDNVAADGVEQVGAR